MNKHKIKADRNTQLLQEGMTIPSLLNTIPIEALHLLRPIPPDGLSEELFTNIKPHTNASRRGALLLTASVVILTCPEEEFAKNVPVSEEISSILRRVIGAIQLVKAGWKQSCTPEASSVTVESPTKGWFAKTKSLSPEDNVYLAVSAHPHPGISRSVTSAYPELAIQAQEKNYRMSEWLYSFFEHLERESELLHECPSILLPLFKASAVIYPAGKCLWVQLIKMFEDYYSKEPHLKERVEEVLSQLVFSPFCKAQYDQLDYPPLQPYPLENNDARLRAFVVSVTISVIKKCFGAELEARVDQGFREAFMADEKVRFVLNYTIVKAARSMSEKKDLIFMDCARYESLTQATNGYDLYLFSIITLRVKCLVSENPTIPSQLIEWIFQSNKINILSLDTEFFRVPDKKSGQTRLSWEEAIAFIEQLKPFYPNNKEAFEPNAFSLVINLFCLNSNNHSFLINFLTQCLKLPYAQVSTKQILDFFISEASFDTHQCNGRVQSLTDLAQCLPKQLVGQSTRFFDLIIKRHFSQNQPHLLESLKEVKRFNELLEIKRDTAIISASLYFETLFSFLRHQINESFFQVMGWEKKPCPPGKKLLILHYIIYKNYRPAEEDRALASRLSFLTMSAANIHWVPVFDTLYEPFSMYPDKLAEIKCIVFSYPMPLSPPSCFTLGQAKQEKFQSLLNNEFSHFSEAEKGALFFALLYGLGQDPNNYNVQLVLKMDELTQSKLVFENVYKILIYLSISIEESKNLIALFDRLEQAFATREEEERFIFSTQMVHELLSTFEQLGSVIDQSSMLNSGFDPYLPFNTVFNFESLHAVVLPFSSKHLTRIFPSVVSQDSHSGQFSFNNPLSVQEWLLPTLEYQLFHLYLWTSWHVVSETGLKCSIVWVNPNSKLTYSSDIHLDIQGIQSLSLSEVFRVIKKMGYALLSECCEKGVDNDPQTLEDLLNFSPHSQEYWEHFANSLNPLNVDPLKQPIFDLLKKLKLADRKARMLLCGINTVPVKKRSIWPFSAILDMAKQEQILDHTCSIVPKNVLSSDQVQYFSAQFEEEKMHEIADNLQKAIKQGAEFQSADYSCVVTDTLEQRITKSFTVSGEPASCYYEDQEEEEGDVSTPIDLRGYKVELSMGHMKKRVIYPNEELCLDKLFKWLCWQLTMLKSLHYKELNQPNHPPISG